MTLIKTSFWTGSSVLIKAIATFILSKIIAIYTGPVGLAFVEQFQNFIQIVRTFSGSLIQQGIVKYVAEYRHDEAIKSRILSSALIICVAVSFILGILLFYFSADLSILVLKSPEYKKIVQVLAASVILFSLNNLFLAVLNGELEIKKYASCNIANTIIILLITSYLVIHQGLYGGLLALVLNQSIILFFTLFLVIKCHWFKLQMFIKGVDLDSLFKLTTYALIMIVSTLAVPISQIIVRNYVAHTLSWQEAGYWQGIMKLSNNYAILIDATLSIYYLPKLSGIKFVSELNKEIINGYKFILPLALLAAILVFILKKYIVIILYSRQFLPMVSLFKYQLIGDIARVGAWLISYVMIAKTMVKTLVLTELSFLIYYSVLTVIFVHYYGLIGTTMSFALSYFLYWISMLFFLSRYTRGLKGFHLI